MGKKRLAVEGVLAAAALPSPPPMAALLPDLTFTDLLRPADPFLQRVLDLLPDADLYLQDEVYIALHPTLTRVWCRRGRRGQRRVQAPGKNAKKCGFGLVDWRDGWFDWALADNRAAEPFCAQLRRAVERSQARGRRAIVLLDNPEGDEWRGKIHPPSWETWFDSYRDVMKFYAWIAEANHVIGTEFAAGDGEIVDERAGLAVVGDDDATAADLHTAMVA